MSEAVASHVNGQVEVWTNKAQTLSKARSQCSCGELIVSDEHPHGIDARRQVERDWARHREYREMHVGLFEDLP
ncbi:MAG TPA: hypothetical protein VMT27_09860 [Actinomycetes bacterium]|nr:hypothetical protein [Actinomycetes bacterium]